MTQNLLASTSLTGVFMPPGTPTWCPDPQEAVNQIAASGFGRIQFDIWYPNPGSVVIGGTTYTLAGLAAYSHSKGLASDFVFHFDGPSPNHFQPLDDPAGTAKWEQDVLEPVQLKAGDTVSGFNEILPHEPGNWPEIIPLYRDFLPSLESVVGPADLVCPLPMSQNPSDALVALQGIASGWLPAGLFTNYKRYGAHVYKQAIPTGKTLSWWFGILDAWSLIYQVPIDVNEFGGLLSFPPAPSLPKSPDPAFYGGVATACQTRNWRYCAWQWPNAGDGFTVGGNQTLISKIVSLGTNPI